MSAEGVVVGRGRQGGMCGEVGVRSGGGCSRLLQRDEFHHDDAAQRDEDRAGPRVLLREERRPLVLVHQPGDEVEVVDHIQSEDRAADGDGLRRGDVRGQWWWWRRCAVGSMYQARLRRELRRAVEGDARGEEHERRREQVGDVRHDEDRERRL